ncbi:MAG: 50S ribosomal protein L32 [Patescibacteria group bacterium]
MAAVPKTKPSSHRQGKRRASHKLSLPEVGKCQHCGADKKPHYLCPSCGKR